MANIITAEQARKNMENAGKKAGWDPKELYAMQAKRYQEALMKAEVLLKRISETIDEASKAGVTTLRLPYREDSFVMHPYVMDVLCGKLRELGYYVCLDDPYCFDFGLDYDKREKIMWVIWADDSND